MAAAALALAAFAAYAGAEQAFLPVLVNTTTIPLNGDLNPYGVAFVPEGSQCGNNLTAGTVLVSNFNNSTNAQGTGTTIIQFDPKNGPITAPPTPGGSNGATVFFTSSQIGLSTALGVLKEGFVLVGNLPTDGNGNVTGPGALQAINCSNGQVVQTFIDPTFLDGPWDLTINDNPSMPNVFVSNVLNGTVTRLDLTVTSSNVTIANRTTIASGYPFRTDPAALVVGPTGLAFDAHSDTLYVASTTDNTIYAVDNATHAKAPPQQGMGKGRLIFSGPPLRGPLALRFAPNGHLLTANGDAIAIDPAHPSEIVEFTKQGQFVRAYNVDASIGGAFGIDTVFDPKPPFNYAAIDDVTNSLSVMLLPSSMDE